MLYNRPHKEQEQLSQQTVLEHKDNVIFQLCMKSHSKSMHKCLCYKFMNILLNRHLHNSEEIVLEVFVLQIIC